MPHTSRTRRVTARLLVAFLAVALLATACSNSDGDSSESKNTTTTTSPVPQVREKPANGLRLAVHSNEPLFLLNLAIAIKPEDIRKTYENWPEDLRWMLGFQVIYDAHNPMPDAERGPALDKILDVTDDLKVPTIVQVGTFLGWGGPDRAVLDEDFEEHPSFAGVALAELSAGFETATGGITDDQRQMVVDAMDVAVDNKAAFLWADMGYLGPLVFVSAGADKRIADIMQKHPENMIIQVKQNGMGRRFGSWSSAFGFFAADFAGAWGVNSEDWLWWEASLEKLYGPQVPGGITVEGMTKSDFPNRSRLTYPDALYGTEMLVAASSGATVFLIESPDRMVDSVTRKPTATAEQVVFPLLRLISGSHLIPTRSDVLDRTKIAFQPTADDQPEFAFDEAFTGLYGPEGCTKETELSCTQRQWLPSTGRYGIIPTIPALTPAATLGEFVKVVRSLAGTPEERRSIFDDLYPDEVKGDSWAAPGGGGSWFVGNPNENTDQSSKFELPAVDGTIVGGTLSPQSFAVVTTTSDALGVFFDNFRSDSDGLWDPKPTKDVPAKQTTAGDPAPSAESRFVLKFADRTDEPKVTSKGGKVTSAWNADSHELTVTVNARGPVTLTIG
ncbi:MAG: hypothetical protein KDB02_12685 [Acidimicrobiales bacterium]|nr:hypothetical protein [Acidimicrobiales bacterium]